MINVSAQTIYTQLINAGMSKAGACGLMGNMQAESAMRANNAQDGMTRLSDAEYTAAVDNGSYTNFVRDAVGYGLCQWTFWSRKQALLNYAKSRTVSIGNEAMQVDFAINELKSDFPGLWKFLCTTTDVNQASSRVCVEYERPAVNNLSVRAAAALKFFNEMNDEAKTEPAPAPSSKHWPPRVLAHGMTGSDVSALQAVLLARGYNIGITGTFGDTTLERVKEFQEHNALDVDGICGPLTWAALLKK